MWLPGLPSLGTPDEAAYRVAFWSALHAGTVCGIITGLIVGLAIWRIQAHFEERRTHADYEREFLILCLKLRRALRRPDIPLLGYLSQSGPSSAITAVELFDDNPLSLWRQELSDRLSLIDGFISLRDTYHEFTEETENLDNVIGDLIRQHNYLRGFPPQNDMEDRAFYLGYILGMQERVILVRMGAGDEQLPRFNLSVQLFEGIPEIRSGAEAYLQRRRRILEMTNNLLEWLPEAWII